MERALITLPVEEERLSKVAEHDPRVTVSAWRDTAISFVSGLSLTPPGTMLVVHDPHTFTDFTIRFAGTQYDVIGKILGNDLSCLMLTKRQVTYILTPHTRTALIILRWLTGNGDQLTYMVDSFFRNYIEEYEYTSEYRELIRMIRRKHAMKP